MILIDTHVLVWITSRNPKLGSRARDMLDTGDAGEVFVSAITPWEIALLDKKGRLPLGMEVSRWLDEVLGHPRIKLIPLEPAIAVESVRLPGDFHNDPADRIIVATARHLSVPLFTADEAILAYAAHGYLSVVDATA
ncbi:type II toxin-antitoxin system VapC family toxin [Neorhizobium sp. DT-125]|uniref:type II toxin-antitoxin system VapC family toxin n=1 Tax=Neorhizobium sp. DT-125 TaxID=3396163 RepID=UPI003F1B85CD